MKNLQLLELVQRTVPDVVVSHAETFAVTSDATYFISGSLYKHDFKPNTIRELCPQTFGDVLCIKVLGIENKICIVTVKELYIFDLEERTELQKICFEEEVAAVSWSPTDEVVVLVTESNNVVTGYIDYEHAELFVESQNSVNVQIPDTVYVGWGSHETQFRGTAGKYKSPTLVEAAPVSDRKPTISWRGNGEMFVVNYWTDNSRAFVVFDASGKALFRSERSPGLQPQIAWRPTGNMIASLCFTTTKQSVTIFEKNGQKRFSFDLDLCEMTVKRIVWSPCASILTIITQARAGCEQNIHLFVASNYKWFEKQRLVFRSDNRLLGCEWLETSQFTFTLRVVTERQIVNYTFTSVVNASFGVCGVISGCKLQITDFKNKTLPPPLFLNTLVNDSCINFVCFFNDLVAVVDSHTCVKITHLDHLDKVIYSQKLDEIVADRSKIALALHHFVLEHDSLYFALEKECESVFYQLNYKTGACCSVATTTNPVRNLLVAEDDAYGFQRIYGNLHMNECSDYVIQQVKRMGDVSYTCRFTWTGSFYVNDHKMSDSASSFLVFDDYLLYTTKQNRLFCARFREITDATGDSVYCRNLEQGAVLVAAVPATSLLVLQMPRGNLETISCRLISIDILDGFLERHDWNQALRFLRLEKLNANLLYDLNPARFLTRIPDLVGAVSTRNELNNLVLEFEPGNVLKTMYKNWGRSQDDADKIARVFGAFFQHLDHVDYADYATTVVVVNVNFFTVRAALVYVQDLYRRAGEDARLVEKLQEAVKAFKVYGCDQERLYVEALLLYDLDLARFVAGQCQMDPRVYQPHLEHLEAKAEAERRFDINVFAKKYDKAVAYMMRTDKFTSDDVRAFIKMHQVGKKAYATCPRRCKHFQVVSRTFAEELSTREAAAVLYRAGLFEEAFQKCVTGLCWKEALLLAQELNLEEETKRRLISEMARGLVQRQVYKEAAVLYEEHANEHEKAAEVLMENYLFEEAVHVAKRHKRADLLAEIVGRLLRYKDYLGSRLKELQVTYNRHKSRLGVVRKARLDRFRHGDDDDDKNDLFSEAGSTISRSSKASRSTTASSRSRRKEERKRQDLREGGVYEDIALIRALYGTMKEVGDKGEDVSSCCRLLLQESDTSFKELKEFYDFYCKVESDVKCGAAEIWPPHFYKCGETQDAGELADLENFEHLDVEFRTAPNFDFGWKLGLFG